MQASCQGEDAVVAGGAEDESTQLIIVTQFHIQASIGLTSAAPCHLAAICAWTWQGLNACRGHSSACFAVADTHRASITAVKERILGTQVEIRGIEKQRHRNGAQFPVGTVLAQSLVQRV